MNNLTKGMPVTYKGKRYYFCFAYKTVEGIEMLMCEYDNLEGETLFRAIPRYPEKIKNMCLTKIKKLKNATQMSLYDYLND